MYDQCGQITNYIDMTFKTFLTISSFNQLVLLNNSSKNDSLISAPSSSTSSESEPVFWKFQHLKLKGSNPMFHNSFVYRAYVTASLWPDNFPIMTVVYLACTDIFRCRKSEPYNSCIRLHSLYSNFSMIWQKSYLFIKNFPFSILSHPQRNTSSSLFFLCINSGTYHAPIGHKVHSTNTIRLLVRIGILSNADSSKCDFLIFLFRFCILCRWIICMEITKRYTIKR